MKTTLPEESTAASNQTPTTSRSKKDNPTPQDSNSLRPRHWKLLLVGGGIGLLGLSIILTWGLMLFYANNSKVKYSSDTPLAIATLAPTHSLPLTLTVPTSTALPSTPSPSPTPVVPFLYEDSLLLPLPTVFDLPADFAASSGYLETEQAQPPFWPDEVEDEPLFNKWQIQESASMRATKGNFLSANDINVELARFAESAGAQAALDYWLANYIPPEYGIAAEPLLGEVAYGLQLRPTDPRTTDPFFGEVQRTTVMYRRGNVLVGIQVLSRSGETDLQLAYEVAAQVDTRLLAAPASDSLGADLRLLLPAEDDIPRGFGLFQPFSGWVDNPMAAKQTALLEAKEALAEASASSQEPDLNTLLNAMGLTDDIQEQTARLEQMGRVTGYALTYYYIDDNADPYNPSLLASYVSVYSSTEAARAGFAEQTNVVPVSPLVDLLDAENTLITDYQVGEESRIVKGTRQTGGVIWAIAFRREALIVNIIYVGMADLTDFETVLTLAESVDNRVLSRSWTTFSRSNIPPLIVTPIAPQPSIETMLRIPDNVQIELPFEELRVAPLLSPQGTYMATFGQIASGRNIVLNRATGKQIIIGSSDSNIIPYDISQIGWLEDNLLYVYSTPLIGGKDPDKFHILMDLTNDTQLLVEQYCIDQQYYQYYSCKTTVDLKTAQSMLHARQIFSDPSQKRVVAVGEKEAYAFFLDHEDVYNSLLTDVDHQKVRIFGLSFQTQLADAEILSATAKYRAVLDHEAALISIYAKNDSLLGVIAGTDFWEQEGHYPGQCQINPQAWEPDESALWIGVECVGELNPDNWSPTEVYYTAVVKLIISEN